MASLLGDLALALVGVALGLFIISRRKPPTFSEMAPFPPMITPEWEKKCEQHAEYLGSSVAISAPGSIVDDA